ncbi:MAG: hypothetical protein KDD37_05460 [Bdellovibrionales bacterium]|nr:hypothetical protein [Bdellovibrionales bacterium]
MLIWLLGMAFANNLCSVDYYNPPLEVFSQYQCLEEDLRNPASIEKLKPQLNASKDGLNPKWTSQQRRIYHMLRSKRFDGFDANGDGTSDISITKLQGGGQKITFANRGDGKITQISVFDTYGKLVSERIDTDMDGHVDQVYECKDQVCERKFNIVNGKATSMVRTIASSDNKQVVEVYEAKNGDLQFVERNTQPVKILDFANSFTEGDFCFTCYDKNYSKFSEMLKDFENKPKPIKLPKIDDFYMSRVGVLIHEECFEIYGDKFDVEQAVTDSVVKGFSCMMKGKEFANKKEASGDTFYANGGAAYTSHIPRLVNLFTQQKKINYAPIRSTTSDGAKFRMDLKNPCKELSKIPGYENLPIYDDCKFVPEVELGRPKIFCNPDELTLAAEKREGTDLLASAHDRALGSLPNSVYPLYKNWKGKTKVYNPPAVTFLPAAHGIDEGTFQSTLWHELNHNCGYEHNSKEHMDPYFCQVACFWNEHASKTQSPSTRAESAKACISNAKPTSSDNAAANRIGNTLSY